MTHPRRSAAPHVQPPPTGEPEVDFDVADVVDELRTHRSFAAASVDGDGIPTTPAMTGGTMKRRPGIDDEEPDTEPTGWLMPDWED